MSAAAEYKRWLDSPALTETERAELLSIGGDEKEIESRFFAPLEFGTAGLRGVMGAGLNRMNIHIVRWTTQAFAEVILADNTGGATVAVCHDPRHQARAFAIETACVFAANGISVLLFDDMRPTPELSFAVREYRCAAGVNVTASHNTCEYNGYKVYGRNGAQLPPDDAKRVAELMSRNDVFSSPKTVGYTEAVSRGLIKALGAETDEKYLFQVLALTTEPALKDLRIVYTPFHGTGRLLVPEALRRMGFRNVFPVESQMTPDGDFGTVKFPNPEYAESFSDAIVTAKKVGADIIIGTDPDADRVAGLARHGGKYIHISGHSMGALLLEYYADALRRSGRMPEKPVALKTIVTTELARSVAESAGIECRDTFTGFKFMAELKDEIESAGRGHVIFSYEESYGCMTGDFVRDKDGVSASALISEMAAFYLSRNMTLIDALNALYKKHGYHGESTVSLLMPGVDGLRDMQTLMAALRGSPPDSIADYTVAAVRDYLAGSVTARTGETSALELRGSDVLRFDLEDGTAVLVRPSGTEPKIKIYILARGSGVSDCAEKIGLLEAWANGLPNLIKDK